jgi:hypothetical protein
VLRADGLTGVGERLEEGLMALTSRGARQRTADDGDLPVPQRHQVLGGKPGALPVVDEDEVDVGARREGTVHQHHGDPGEGRLVQHGVGLHRRDEDESVGARGEVRDEGDLAGGVLVAVGQQHPDVVPGERRLDAVDERGEQRVGDVRDDHPDTPVPAGAQATSGLVRAVAQLLDGRVDAVGAADRAARHVPRHGRG